MATGIGETLRTAREERHLRLEDAAAETRIRASHLAALEREDFDRLGGDVYVRGFIRSYAKALQLDPEPLLAQHRSAAPAEHAGEPLPLHHEPLDDGGPTRGRGLVVAAIALLAIVGLAVWGGGDDPDRVDMDRDPLAETERGGDDAEPDEPDAGGGAATPTPTPTPTPAEGDADDEAGDDGAAATAGEGVRVRLEVTDRDVWLRALVDGDEVLQETLRPGSTETFDGEAEVRLRLGDAGAVELFVDGESVGSPGGDGEPVWVTIDADGEVTLG